MWFRIELHKDGSVASCAEVEGSFKDSRHVLYVEADNKADALMMAAQKYDRIITRASARNKNRRARLKKEGKCERCGRERDDPKRTMCVACRDQHKKVYRPKRSLMLRLKRAGEDVSHLVRTAPSPEEKARRLASYRKTARDAIKLRRSGWNADSLHMPTLLEVITKYDKLSPRAFRSWLEEAAGVPESERVGVAAE